MSLQKRVLVNWICVGAVLVALSAVVGIFRLPQLWLAVLAVAAAAGVVMLRSPGYAVYSLMSIYARPADEKENRALRRWLLPKAMENKAVIRRMVRYKRFSGFCCLKKEGETALCQVFCAHHRCYLVMQKKGGKLCPWMVSDILSQEQAPQEALPSNSLFRRRRLLSLVACLIVLVGCLGSYTLAFQLAHPEVVGIRGSLRRAVTALNMGQQMEKEQFSSEQAQAFENAAFDWSKQVLDLRAAFTGQMEEIGYTEILLAANIKADQALGLHHTVEVLKQGETFAKQHFDALEACSTREALQQLFASHGVSAEWQKVYFDEFDTFTAGNGERFLRPYQLAVTLGEFLQENATAFTVNDETGPVFADATLAKRYEQIKIDLQAALSE